MTTLDEEDEVYQGRPFEDLAAALTRRLLRQTLLALGPTDRIFATAPGRWQRLRLLWGGGQQADRQLDALTEALTQPAPLKELPTLLESHRFPPDQALRLVEGHLRRYEVGTDLRAAIRRELYSAMAKRALRQDTEALGRFLGGDYLQVDTRPGPRFEIVTRLLQTLTEACALVRLPVVFAFDNLERLFSPQNRVDASLIRAFLNSLAQAVDNTKGILFFLFAEQGLFESQIAPQMDSFASGRLRQGVPLHGQGPVEVVRIKPPTAEEILQLVHTRMRRHLENFSADGQLSPGFPFESKFLQDTAAAHSQTLRATLERLRDEYSRVVYGRPLPGDEQTQLTPAQIESILQARFKAAQLAAGWKLTGSLASQAPALHAGLGMLLQHALPWSLEGWDLVRVHSTITIGENPTYGVATLLDWQSKSPANGRDAANATLRVAIGFLLAGGTGMAADLSAKFDIFREKVHAVDRLVVLWHTQKEEEDLASALPSITKKAWDGFRFKSRSEIRRLGAEELRILAAFPDWLNAVREEVPEALLGEQVRVFIQQRFQPVLRAVAVSGPSPSLKVPVDEN